MPAILSLYPHDLPRLYLSVPLRAGQDVPLPDGQAHYLRHVLRCAEGDLVRVFNAADGEWKAQISFPSKKAVLLQVRDLLRPASDGLQQYTRHLVFSPIKKDRQDWLIEKSVELGVTDFHPVVMNRSVIRDIKEERVRAQIIEASEQCERLDLPTLHPVKNLKQFMQQFDSGSKIYAAIERQDAVFLGDILRKEAVRDATYMVGPEGGFDQEEVAFLSGFSCVCPVSLGPRILRSETAALYGLSLLSSPFENFT
ncbi:MAG: hypothetical protein AUJ12_08515 [Alphaproteobacteria bacterium CG1_02_46_17]|nr:MAG: hypothetical protein AUJ12_08515 [Alphaproteobacteria bacterium CG1_02_46_17]